MKKILLFTIVSISISASFAQEVSKKEKKNLKELSKTAKKVDVKTEKPEIKSADNVAVPAATEITNKVTDIQPIPAQVAPVPPVDANKIFEFTNDNYDFGKIVGGKPVEYIVTIKNISKEEATLTMVNPTCGCTTPKYEANKKFAPGESVQVTLGFNGGSPGQASPFSKTDRKSVV